MNIVDFVCFAKRLGFSVSVSEQHKGSERIIMLVDYPHPPSKNALISLLKELPESYAVEYYDFFKDMPDSAIAYISAYRAASGYSLSSGSSEWGENKSQVSFDSLAESISKNWEHSDSSGNFKNQIIIEPAQYIMLA